MIVFVNRYLLTCKLMCFYIKHWFLVIYDCKMMAAYLLV